MVSDEVFKSDDPRYRLAMLSEALTRICRLIAGIRLHSGEWSIEQATTLFEQAAIFRPRRQARRPFAATYDPTYGATPGKLP